MYEHFKALLIDIRFLCLLTADNKGPQHCGEAGGRSREAHGTLAYC